jgi:hypothetical protein
VLAIPANGIPPYTYRLYKDTLLPANLVLGPQSNPVFSNLDAHQTYILTVTDTCGSGTNVQATFANLHPVVALSDTLVPCLNDSFTLSVLRNPNMTYQWYKDDTLITGATDTFYHIASMGVGDYGVYRVNIYINGCLLLSQSIPLTLTDGLCGKNIEPLPIKLLSFNAYAKGNTALLQWATATETDNKGFYIQRSADAAKWADVGFVATKAPNGNGNGQYNYDYTDTKPLNGSNFYRLRDVSLNGKVSYSEVRELVFGKASRPLQIHPNPAKDELNVTFSATTGDVTYKLTSTTGKIVQQGKLNGKNGIGKLNVKGLPSGMYFLQIITGNTVQTGKVEVGK